VLRDAGAAVGVAYDGRQALAQAQAAARADGRGRFDAAVLDIGLPGIDGCELAGRLRPCLADGATLVALTGWGHEADRQRIAAAGFHHHLLKPANAAQLRALLAANVPAPSQAG
jgi:two-component system, sensor histidine kinase